jgi:hypothetical protein
MANKALSLLANRTATATGSTFKIQPPTGQENVPVVIRGITTATVLIEGSLDGTNWGTLTSKTADFYGTVAAFPFMRARISAYTSGTISVDLWADQRFG